MGNTPPQQEPKERNPMFEATSGTAKGIIEAILFKCIGVERNAKINHKGKKKK